MLLSIIALLVGCSTLCPPHDYYIKHKGVNPDTTLVFHTPSKATLN